MTCRKCGRTTWAGCGNHVDQVMRRVPAAERCTCGQQGAARAADAPSAGVSGGAGASGGGWLGRLFGR
ncbi:hypothetical protein [Citricoccus sp. SGAir0253]|uniref:hypothetical protein n=1 Tax=Citricoccus sp. SGAir0253 TaxID=2567881 RepID=UPI00352AE2FE